MPAYSQDQIECFRRAHPQRIAWLTLNPAAFPIGTDEDIDNDWGDLRDVRMDLFRHGALTTSQVRIVKQAMFNDNSQAPNEPANAWEGLTVPNGKFHYICQMRGSDEIGEYDFQVYTVTSGQLAQKRVVKVRHPGSSVYKAFGFITRTGKFRLWRRYEADQYAGYVRAASDFIDMLRNLITSSIARAALGGGNLARPRLGVQRNIEQIKLACLKCNHIIEGSRSYALVGLCDDHFPHRVDLDRAHALGRFVVNRDEPPVHVRFLMDTDEHGVGEHRVNELLGTAQRGITLPPPQGEHAPGFQAAPRRRPSVTAPLLTPRERSEPLPRCELGTGEIQ